MQETWVQSLGRENPLAEGMATHFSILAGKIPWTEEPGGLQSQGCKQLHMTEQLSTDAQSKAQNGEALDQVSRAN